MSPNTYALGTASYVDQDKNIQLRVTGSVQLSGTGQKLLRGDVSSLFEAVKSGKIWISWPPSLLFRLSARIHGHLHTHRNTESIFNEMAEILGTAQLWSDLHMVVASQSYDVACHHADFGQLDIAFQIQEDTMRSPGKKPANVPSAVWTYFNSCGPVQPRSGTPLATIERVDASLDFFPAVTGPRLVPSSPRQQKLLLREDCEHSYENCFSGPPGDNLFSDFIDSTSESETWESLDDDSPFCSQQSANSSSSTYTWPESVNPGIDRIASMLLLDSGFRGLFSSKLPPKNHGQKHYVEEKKNGLIELAPSIFNPKYRTAVSQRAWLIPNITKSLTILITNSQSSIIESKVQALKSAFSKMHNPNTSVAQQQEMSSLNTSEMIQCLLWKSMQRELRNRRTASPQLSPLSTGTQSGCFQANTLFAAMDQCWDDSLFDDTELIDDEFDDNDPEYDILMEEEVNDDDDEDQKGYEKLVDGIRPDVSNRRQSAIDELADTMSDNSLMLTDADEPELPPTRNTPEPAEPDALAARDFLDKALHPKTSILDYTSLPEENVFGGPDVEGDVEMLLL